MDKKKSKTKFLKVKCKACGNEQVIFSAPSMTVKCLVCEKELGFSTGSRLKLCSKLLSEFS